MFRQIFPVAAVAAALLLGACSGNDGPAVDPHNQVPFPGSNPVTDPDALSDDLGGPIENAVPQVADPAVDPRCSPLSTDALMPSYRCTVNGVTYVRHLRRH